MEVNLGRHSLLWKLWIDKNECTENLEEIKMNVNSQTASLVWEHGRVEKALKNLYSAREVWIFVTIPEIQSVRGVYHKWTLVGNCQTFMSNILLCFCNG